MLEKLKEEQTKRHMSDRAFAALLGVPRITWTFTRNGRKPIGQRVARAAMVAFPYLKWAVVSFLVDGDTGVTKTVTRDTRDLAEVAGG